MSQGNIYVVTAPSGAGKTTLVRALLAADHQIQLSISFTSRPPRVGEVHGKDYHFVSRTEFEGMISACTLLEYAEVFGNYYGTSQDWIQSMLAQGQDILLEIDWQGAQQVRRVFPEARGIFILPPSLTSLEARLRGRGKDNEDVIIRRLSAAKEEISHVDEFDYIIINDHFEEALRDIAAIIRSERLKLDRQSTLHQAMISAMKG